MKRQSLLKAQTSGQRSTIEDLKVGKIRQLNTKTEKELTEDVTDKMIRLETQLEKTAQQEAKEGGQLLQGKDASRRSVFMWAKAKQITIDDTEKKDSKPHDDTQFRNKNYHHIYDQLYQDEVKKRLAKFRETGEDNIYNFVKVQSPSAKQKLSIRLNEMNAMFMRQQEAARGLQVSSNVYDLQNKSMEVDRLARSRELMCGRYVLSVPPGASFQEKLQKMSNEEVAFFLYLNRHQEVKTKDVVERQQNKKKAVLKTVLRDTILSNNSIYQKRQQPQRQSSPDSDDSTKQKEEPKQKLSLAERVKLKHKGGQQSKNEKSPGKKVLPPNQEVTEESEEIPVQIKAKKMTPAEKAEQLRQLIKVFNKNKLLRERDRDEIEFIARSYQELEIAAKRAQIEERDLEQMGIKISKKQKIENSQEIVNQSVKDLNYFQMAVLSSHFLETSKSVDQSFKSSQIKQAKKEAEMRMKNTLTKMQQSAERHNLASRQNTGSSFFTNRQGLRDMAKSNLSLSKSQIGSQYGSVEELPQRTMQQKFSKNRQNLNVSYQNFSTKYSNSLALQKMHSPKRNFSSQHLTEKSRLPDQYQSQTLPKNSRLVYQDQSLKTQKELNRQRMLMNGSLNNLRKELNGYHNRSRLHASKITVISDDSNRSHEREFDEDSGELTPSTPEREIKDKISRYGQRNGGRMDLNLKQSQTNEVNARADLERAEKLSKQDKSPYGLDYMRKTQTNNSY